MRRTIPYAVAVVATIVAVLAVMVGVGIGQPTFSHGAPSEVFMKTDGGAVCSTDPWGLEVNLAETSHLLVYFTGEWTRLGDNKIGYLWFNLDGTEEPVDWNFHGHKNAWTTGTIMWTFADVPAGDHWVYAKSEARRISGGGPASARVSSCALTVMVIPAE